MEKQLAQKFHDIAIECAYADEDMLSVREYKPRFSNKTTFGIVGLDPLTLLKLVVENADQFVEEDRDSYVYPSFKTVNFQSDNMGRQTIIY